MRVFVFGSNLAGRHGKGAALEAARNWGAVYGCGEGFMNRGVFTMEKGCYAIPTKDERLISLSLPEIRASVLTFLDFARNWADWNFLVTRIGCGLAGYKDEQVAPMFMGAASNCRFDPLWKRWGLRTWEQAP